MACADPSALWSVFICFAAFQLAFLAIVEHCMQRGTSESRALIREMREETEWLRKAVAEYDARYDRDDDDDQS